MSSPRAFVLSCVCALAPLACDTPPAPQKQPPTSTPTPDPATPTANDAVAHEHYIKALEFESAGRYVEAKIEVDQALANGGGRDVRVLAAKLAVLRNDLDGASALLAPLAGDMDDALVQYNLGLIAQRRNEYNKARSAYLAATKADPTLALARFNLAILTWDAGVREEAQHHARKFIEMTPDDPRAAELRVKVELEAGPAAPTPTGLKSPFAKSGDAKAPAAIKEPSARDTKKGKPDEAGLKDPFAKDGAVETR